MLNVINKITCRVTLEWEKDGIYDLNTEGYRLEDGSLVARVYGSWEGEAIVYEPVSEGGEIIGFIPSEKARIEHIGAIKLLDIKQ